MRKSTRFTLAIIFVSLTTTLSQAGGFLGNAFDDAVRNALKGAVNDIESLDLGHVLQTITASDLQQRCPMCGLAEKVATQHPLTAEDVVLLGKLNDDLSSLNFLARMWLADIRQKRSSDGLSFAVQSPFSEDDFFDGKAMAAFVILPSEDVGGTPNRWSRFQLTLAFLSKSLPNPLPDGFVQSGQIAIEVSDYEEAIRAGADKVPEFSYEWKSVETKARKALERDLTDLIKRTADASVNSAVAAIGAAGH